MGFEHDDHHGSKHLHYGIPPEGKESVRIPLGAYAHAKLPYPRDRPVALAVSDGQLEITLCGVSARLLRLW